MPKYSIVQGVGGDPKCFFVLLEPSYFCDVGAHANFRNPTTSPSGVLNNGIKNKNKRKEKNLPRG